MPKFSDEAVNLDHCLDAFGQCVQVGSVVALPTNDFDRPLTLMRVTKIVTVPWHGARPDPSPDVMKFAVHGKRIDARLRKDRHVIYDSKDMVVVDPFLFPTSLNKDAEPA